MRTDRMGRNRKKLIEKSTSILFRLDNETIFKLCDKLDIEYNKDSEIMEDAVKTQVIAEIKQIIKEFVK